MKDYTYNNFISECINLTFQKSELEKVENSCHNLNLKMSEKHKKGSKKTTSLKNFIINYCYDLVSQKY